MKPTATRSLEQTPERTSEHEKESIVPGEPAQPRDVKDDDIQYLTGIGLFGVVLALCLCGFLLALDSSILATAIPRITSHFHSIDDIGWYGSAYFLTLCSFQPLAGKLYTQFSSKYTFFASLGVFEAGSLICATSSTSAVLIVGRGIAGIGSSGMSGGAITILSASAPLERRPVLIGLYMSMMAAAAVAGPLIGGALTQHLSWRWCFYINLPAGAVAGALLLLLHIPERKQDSAKSTKRAALARLDPIGFLLFAPACTMVLLAIQWGGVKHAWKSATIIGLLSGSFLFLLLFIAWEHRRGDQAMVPLDILFRSPVLFSAWTGLFQMGSQMVISYYLPIWFQVVQGVGPTASGVRTLPTMISQMTAALVAGVLVQKIGYPALFTAIGSAISAIGAGLMTTFIPSTGAGKWIGYQIIIGAGRGTLMQMPVVAVQAVLPASQVSIGPSLILLFQFFGGALFLAFGQTTFISRLHPALQYFAPSVDAQVVIDAGAASVRRVVSTANLEAVLLAFNRALIQTFYLALGAACVSFAMSWGMGWTSIKRKQKKGVSKV